MTRTAADGGRVARVMHVIDKLSVEGSKISGPPRQIAYRYPYYDHDRFELFVCSLREEEPAADLLREAGLEVVCLGRGKFDPLAIVDLFGLVRRWQPSLLHLDGYASSNFGRVVGKACGLPIVVQEHFVDEHMPWYQRVADWLLRGTEDHALAVAEPVKDFMARERHVPREKIDVILTSVPRERFAAGPDVEEAELRARIGLRPDSAVVGTVGRLAEMKGHRFLVEAIPRIRERAGNVEFVVVGEGPLRDELIGAAEAAGVLDCTFFVGYRADVASYYELFDLCVLASTHGEGFPAVAIEAMAAGTPVVLTDLPAFRQSFTHGHDAWMVPAGDPEALAEAIVELLAAPERAERMARNALEVVEETDTPRIARQYMDAYERVLAAASGAR